MHYHGMLFRTNSRTGVGWHDGPVQTDLRICAADVFAVQSVYVDHLSLIIKIFITCSCSSWLLDAQTYEAQEQQQQQAQEQDEAQEQHVYYSEPHNPLHRRRGLSEH